MTPDAARRLEALGLWAVVIGLFVAGRAFPASETLQALSPACPTRALTSLPCPLCGLTRVTVLLAHGHPVEALALAPLPTLLLVGLLSLAIARTVGGKLPLPRALRGRRGLVIAGLLWAYALGRAVVAGG